MLRPSSKDFAADVRRRLERAERRERYLESDAAFEANRETIAQLRATLDEIKARAGA